MQKQWSEDLQKEMEILSPTQRRAIAMIVTGEANGITLSRLLKTAHSCQWCGREIGRSTDKKDVRKAALTEHEADCSRIGKPWRFAANHSTFYGKWGQHFKTCLSKARQEVVDLALGEAARVLQFGTPEAARELLRQISGAVEDRDRRLAAVALLDRADISTASKGPDPLAGWLDELRGDDGPMADDDAEVGDVQEDEV